MVNIFNDIYSFIIGRNKDIWSEKKSFSLKELLYFVLLSFYVSFIIMIFNRFIFTLFNIAKPIHFETTGVAQEIILTFLSSIVFAPIIEEFIFRLPLQFLSKYSSSIFLIRFFYFLLALLFGLAHITNYTNYTDYNCLQWILITLPQISAGLILGYACLKYKGGFLISMSIHASFNALILLLNC